MLNIVLIRHFATEGNLQKRYVGRTDEPLCKEGRKALEQVSYPKAEAVFVSPLLRCRESAQLIYPHIKPIICEDFKECDFGAFEYKNYLELSDDARYQAFIDSNGTLPFPQGESPKDFKKRSIQEFKKVVETSHENGYQTIALVVHGGTIMSIMEQFAYPKEEYYHWQTGNGNGYIACLEEEKGRIINVCSIHSLP